MGKTLKEYPSTSNPMKSHNVTLGEDGVIYCTCMGWKMHRNCTHLKQFYNEKHSQTLIKQHQHEHRYDPIVKLTDDEEVIETSIQFIGGK